MRGRRGGLKPVQPNYSGSAGSSPSNHEGEDPAEELDLDNKTLSRPVLSGEQSCSRNTSDIPDLPYAESSEPGFESRRYY